MDREKYEIMLENVDFSCPAFHRIETLVLEFGIEECIEAVYRWEVGIRFGSNVDQLKIVVNNLNVWIRIFIKRLPHH